MLTTYYAMRAAQMAQRSVIRGRAYAAANGVPMRLFRLACVLEAGRVN